MISLQSEQLFARHQNRRFGTPGDSVPPPTYLLAAASFYADSALFYAPTQASEA
jgi:hypothetical protein